MDPDHESAATWGPHDERGMLNAIDASAVLAALQTVRQGRVIALSQTLGPNTPVPAHRPAVARFMNRDGGDYAAGGKRPGGFQFAEDTFLLPTHSGTHIDALAHAWHDDLLYNGFPGDTIRSTTGAQRCGADKLGPIVGRGVLIDLTLEGALSAGQAVTAEHLQSAVTTTGIELERGDIVLLYTGWLEQHGGNPDIYFTCEPGLDLTGARWLADHGVAAIGADNVAVEQIPFRDGEVFPVHQLLIRDRGVPLIEGLVLDELARARATSFLFIALPLKLEGATASPLAPVAIL